MNLKMVIDQIEKEKGFDRRTIIESIEEAIVSAAQRKLGKNKIFEAQYNEDTGEVDLFEFKDVVDNPEDPDTQISLEEARKYDPEAQIGDQIGLRVEVDDLGRIAAQAAKQVLFQKLRDAEKELIYKEFKTQKDKIVTGTVLRMEGGAYVVDLGKTEAILPYEEQIPRERFKQGDPIRAYVLDIQKSTRGPRIILSRAAPQFLVKLFESEVSEVRERTVEIVSVAREPGVRAKVAVRSKSDDIDPVGTCVGYRGSRVQNVVNELRGEKIDIIEWNPDPAKFIAKALSPAQISEIIVDEDLKTVHVIVPDDQQSLAIGRRGVNVRLAVQLTGWNIDIISESKMNRMREQAYKLFTKLPDVGRKMAELLLAYGFRSLEDIAEAEEESLARVPGVNKKYAKELIAAAKELIEKGEGGIVITGEDEEAEAEKKEEDEKIEKVQDEVSTSEASTSVETTATSGDQQESNEDASNETEEQEEH